MSTGLEKRRQELRDLAASLRPGPIEPSDPRYFDFSAAPGQPRGDEPGLGLSATISLHASATTCQLFSGQPGSGTTTELRRVASELTRGGFPVVFVAMADLLPLTEAPHIVDLMSAISLAVSEHVSGLAGGEEIASALHARLSRLLGSAQSEESSNLASRAGATVIAEWREDASFRAHVRSSLEARSQALFAEIRSILSDARAFLMTSGSSASPVILVDDLEKVGAPSAAAADIRAAFERVFGGFHHVVRIDGWHSIWTVPLSLQLHNAALPSLYDGSLHLPLIRLWRRDPARSKDEAGLLAARECVRRRGDVDSLFGKEELLDEVLRASSGHLREMFGLVAAAVREVWKQRDPALPLGEESVRRIVLDHQRMWRLHVFGNDLPLLSEVVQTRELTARTEAELARLATLVDSGVIVSYRDGESWWDVSSPILGLVASSEHAEPAPLPAPAVGVFRLISACFSNLRPFDRLDLVGPSGAEDRGQWIVLIGENGVGKSTLLRGLAFALADGSAAAGALGKSPAPYRGKQPSSAQIEVRTADRLFTATIAPSGDGEREALSREPKNGSQRPFLVAYGCQRGSALGGPSREVSFTPELDIGTLFDETRGLTHAETWLLKLEVSAQKDATPRGRALFDAVVGLLKEILHVDEITVGGDAVWVESADTGRARLSALSDGYLTTAGWIVDMIARWIDRARRLGSSVSPGFNGAMEGVVLVDELDLHLHPRWQVRVIDDLRRLFPRMSFVVTTHNPLTLRGALPAEVFVLRRSEAAQEDEVAVPGARVAAGRIEIFQQDVPPGLSADQVLTGAWFGLASTLDRGTLALLEKHRDMLRRGVERDDAGRQSLEAELRRRLGGFADTSLERLAQSVAASLAPVRFEDLGPEKREQLRKNILEAARARAADLGLNPPKA